MLSNGAVVNRRLFLKTKNVMIGKQDYIPSLRVRFEYFLKFFSVLRPFNDVSIIIFANITLQGF